MTKYEHGPGTHFCFDPDNRYASKGKALCSDGKVRSFAVTGYADSFFSIPARVKIKNKTVTGFVYIGTDVYGTADEKTMYFTATGKNAGMLPERETVQ